MDYGEAKSIFYFNEEGKHNLLKTVDLVIERAKELQIKDIIVFTAEGEGAIKVKEMLDNSQSIKVHAATFPYKQVFYIKDGEGLKKEYAGTSRPEKKEELLSRGINLIQGVMPLQDIIMPNAKDIKINSINQTLSLISGGLNFCVQAILMAVDGGHIEPNETVIAMSADTAIVAQSSVSTWLFHPTEGFQILEIICKPKNLTITRKKK